jgi:hypothetical protein
MKQLLTTYPAFRIQLEAGYIIWPFFIILFLGVCQMEAAQESRPDWITFIEPSEQFKASFPHHPVHMQFDLTKDDALTGSLEVYSTSTDQGVLMVNTISSPSLKEFKEQDLSQEFFKNIFYSCFLRRLFYQPKVFKNNESFKVEKTEFQGHPALKFYASYRDDQEKEIMSGMAILKDMILFVVLYITPEKHREDKDFSQFIQSFHLKA